MTSNIIATGGRCAASAEQCYSIAINSANINPDSITQVYSTGYGRKKIPFASDNITEITCHAKGIYSLFNKTRTIIDIGGQDSKVIKLHNSGKVANFVMNDKCAAGTGRFLEVMNRVLDIDLDDVSRLHCGLLIQTLGTEICALTEESRCPILIDY